ncbi:MAG: DUF4238 domain-containing protein [Deltaproteobacteria bacterium]|nr:DUF4238 domain-containing protein [Deltaproteobacteria bacterium]
MKARHHHYLSQCYLKGFTKGGSKKSKLTVIDFKEKKFFETTPRNIGGIRDFNRVDIEGIDPNAVENSYAEFEGKAATALKQIEELLEIDGTNKDCIFTLIALFAIRLPEQRENWRQFQAQILEKLMDLSLATKERWESQITQMKAGGYEANDDISYEDIKTFHKSKAYKIEFPKEHHIRMEMFGINAILPYLQGRNWLLIQSTEESGPFITTDNPVNLSWNEPEKIPPIYRESPGFGQKSTQVYFPLSKNIALLGEFEGKKGLVRGNKQLVAMLNSKMLMFMFKQIYAPKIDFYFLGHNGSILNGRRILKDINA